MVCYLCSSGGGCHLLAARAGCLSCRGSSVARVASSCLLRRGSSGASAHETPLAAREVSAAAPERSACTSFHRCRCVFPNPLKLRLQLPKLLRLSKLLKPFSSLQTLLSQKPLLVARRRHVSGLMMLRRRRHVSRPSGFSVRPKIPRSWSSRSSRSRSRPSVKSRVMMWRRWRWRRHMRLGHVPRRLRSVVSSVFPKEEVYAVDFNPKSHFGLGG